ncbi:dissimilatory nitrite reductase (NO-forming), copper type apoprotein [Fodinibius salinus]|uniref:Copper-containing nitrite reductase n=1 Tax=Fodinibius salinus TaxID=860790 RepID=A0A5D3YLS0_9BACT|nr:copper-containing nitrite reductase [Fodinibius salinus]TYP94830.1 dissimilatory nitrite reductase (NO-forming), copper type apoprotein [Fodinibius salinus]
MSSDKTDNGFSRKQFMKNMGGAMLSGGFLAGALPFGAQAKEQKNKPNLKPAAVEADRVAADPTNIPGPIKRSSPKTHEIELETTEVVAEIEDGVQFRYMTYGDQVPGPMIRVRQGDTVILTLKASENNAMLHNVDFHAVYGTGGGANATFVTPGQSKTIKFKAMYPGAYIYHCAVPRLDYHISSGMYGMIFVEPKEGLPEVDHELYFGQNEVYTQQSIGAQGMHEFDHEAMRDEISTYVLLNGEKKAITADRRGPVKVKKGETARLFFVNGGPNLSSSFHPIGNVWTKAWREGAIASNPERYVQTTEIPPGSCGIFEMDFPVPSTIHLVDHALSRVASKGMMGDIVVEGKDEPDIFDPNYSS